MPVKRIPAERHSRSPRVAAYVRVSSTLHSQDESFETQALYYEKKIQAHSGWDFAGIYGERMSGTHTDNRASFRQMIADALAHRIDLILCKSISRWGRNAAEALEDIKLLNGNHVHIVFEQDSIDTRQPGIIFRLNLMASVAQSESESISENMKWMYRNKASQGIFKPRKRQYFGFNTDDGQFIPDENAKNVKFIFESYAEGTPLSQIADALNKQGVKTRKGNPWSGSSIRSIVTNEVYVGDVRIQKRPSRNVITGKPDDIQVSRYLENHHEGIISRRLWNMAKARLEGIKVTK